MNVLVVDDSSVMRRLHQKALEKMGFTVQCAEDGVEALKSLSAHSCDLMITDLHMPNMDGLALIHSVRSGGVATTIKILMVTSDGVLDVMQKAIEAGANDVLMKPFSNQVFVERVQGLVGEH